MTEENRTKLHGVLTVTIADLVAATMGAIQTPEDAPEVMGIIHCALASNMSALSQFSSAPEDEFVAFCASTIREYVQRGNAAMEKPSETAERILKDILSKRNPQ